MAVSVQRWTGGVAALALATGVLLAPAPVARAAATASFTVDLGCNGASLGRDVEVPAAGRPLGVVYFTGTVTGLTPGTYYYVEVPGAVPPDVGGGAAALGTADSHGSVSITSEAIGLPSSFVSQNPVPFEVHRELGGPGSLVASGSVPVRARGDVACTSLYRLVSGPLTTGVISYGLNLQPDGNVVERTVNYGKTLWTTGTVGHPGAKAMLQTDGNVVVRDTAGRAIWNSGTAGHPGSTLTVQTDSNVVLRDAAGRAVWSTGIHR